MGGNGQFNRLSALDDVADDVGPWRDRLTEDQDLGLRLIGAGWHGHQELRAIVEQQGLPRLRPLYRQRTRWSQGTCRRWGCCSVVRPRAGRARGPAGPARLPADAVMAGRGGRLADRRAGSLRAPTTCGFWDGGPLWQLVFFYLLGFGGVVLGCVARGAPRGFRWASCGGLLVAQVYAFYSWLLWPVLVRATLRQLTDRRGWAKTERERVSFTPPPARAESGLGGSARRQRVVGGLDAPARQPAHRDEEGRRPSPPAMM